MVKSIFILTLAGLTLLTLSCNDLYDYSADKNTPPILKISKIGAVVLSNSLSDSVKISSNSQYQLAYSLTYMTNLSINNEFLTGNGTLTIDELNKQVSFKPKDLGTVIFTLSVTDPFENKSTATVNLLVFDNLPPVAQFVATIKNDVLTVDATGSYDQDKKWGGSIINYEYDLNGVKSVSSNSAFWQSVEANKSYVISLRVQDNNNTWSSIYSKTVNNF